MEAGSNFTFFKDYMKLTKQVGKLTNGQATLGDIEYDEDGEKNYFYLDITPNDGLYKDATCKFQVNMTEGYPADPPDVKCLNNVYHPNIDLVEFNEGDSNASVCVNLLDTDWSRSVGLDGTVMALLFLFHNPNIDDSLNPVIETGMSEEEFAELVKKACMGEELEGIVFDRLYPADYKDGETADENENEYSSDERNTPENTAKEIETLNTVTDNELETNEEIENAQDHVTAASTKTPEEHDNNGQPKKGVFSSVFNFIKTRMLRRRRRHCVLGSEV